MQNLYMPGIADRLAAANHWHLIDKKLYIFFGKLTKTLKQHSAMWLGMLFPGQFICPWNPGSQ